MQHICQDASIVRQSNDKSLSEFDILSYKKKCYYGCNVCRTAQKRQEYFEERRTQNALFVCGLVFSLMFAYGPVQRIKANRKQYE